MRREKGRGDYVQNEEIGGLILSGQRASHPNKTNVVDEDIARLLSLLVMVVLMPHIDVKTLQTTNCRAGGHRCAHGRAKIKRET